MTHPGKASILFALALLASACGAGTHATADGPGASLTQYDVRLAVVVPDGEGGEEVVSRPHIMSLAHQPVSARTTASTPADWIDSDVSHEGEFVEVEHLLEFVVEPSGRGERLAGTITVAFLDRLIARDFEVVVRSGQTFAIDVRQPTPITFEITTHALDPEVGLGVVGAGVPREELQMVTRIVVE